MNASGKIIGEPYERDGRLWVMRVTGTGNWEAAFSRLSQDDIAMAFSEANPVMPLIIVPEPGVEIGFQPILANQAAKH